MAGTHAFVNICIARDHASADVRIEAKRLRASDVHLELLNDDAFAERRVVDGQVPHEAHADSENSVARIHNEVVLRERHSGDIENRLFKVLIQKSDACVELYSTVTSRNDTETIGRAIG